MERDKNQSNLLNISYLEIKQIIQQNQKREKVF